MSDEALLRSVTELARQVWPEAQIGVSIQGTATVSNWDRSVQMFSRPGEEGTAKLYAFLEHPKALEAFEAALYVLIGKDEPLSTSQAKDCWSQGFETAKRLFENPLGRPFRWADRLASSWEERARQFTECCADQSRPLEMAKLLEAMICVCATELREHAKEGT